MCRIPVARSPSPAPWRLWTDKRELVVPASVRTTRGVLRSPEMIVVRLVVPGHLPKMHAKALDAGADEVVFDLEDAVALDAKAAARAVLAETLRRPEWSARPGA